MNKDNNTTSTDTDYWMGILKQKHELTIESILQQQSFAKQVLLAAASIDAIVISLHSDIPQYPHIRLVFFLSVLLLSLGILSVSYLIFHYANHSERRRQAFHKEANNAIQSNPSRRMGIVSIDRSKAISIFEILSYSLLILGFILLVVYTGLRTFTTL